MKKVLLTSVMRPIGPGQGDAPSVGYELLYGQVTRAQGCFSPRANHVQFGLEYIAQNLDAPTTVLHYPSRRELVRELKKGPDVVGVAFIMATFHHMRKVVALVREHAPKAKVVLGGYGTIMSDEALAPYADHVCREEGVAYMRRLLGEGTRPMPYEHPLVVSKLKVFSLPASKTGMVFAGLGCANGCDFCCTSHFFKRRHIRLLPTGRDVFEVMRRYHDEKGVDQFTILDEDFLLNKTRAMEFRAAVLESGRTFSTFCFASMRALSQYKVEELAEMGIDGLWIGYEGTRSGYDKQKGRTPQELFPELRRHGILVLASMIVGFDYQDKEVVADELRSLLRLRPALSQFLIYGPTPGTPFFERMQSEGRMRPELLADKDLYYRSSTGFVSMVTHP
ncbi:MAG: cobalamin-dependent protein, partial [Elusimicrobia bacterium]|nr:cobalamin-dependent protein [Elusimicrobiota bacterium]